MQEGCSSRVAAGATACSAPLPAEPVFPFPFVLDGPGSALGLSLSLPLLLCLLSFQSFSVPMDCVLPALQSGRKAAHIRVLNHPTSCE